ncbi:hypothetical protein [Capnocytophaga canimorsus]|uniref:Uncharacterized protein n=1 Tax=Capnocytophaga canimorsus (strain 5) TaxID=860228 RepID=F9YTK1_CAPCC|nr:hypothetical protein [Capnocytophaga canimorsus]AEK22863.1 Conserved hypothetical protein [Capnocytophaga canimorsus Cc5]
MMRKFISLLLLLPLVGCQFFEKKNASQKSDKPEVVTDTTLKNEENNSSKIVKYVIDRQGTWFKEKPEESSENQNSMQYGYRIEVEGEQGDYYKAMNYETGNYAYVLKSKVGDLSQISLIASDLDKISLIQKGEQHEPVFYEEAITLETLISFELIDKSLYEKAKKSAVDFLLRDTLSVVKKNNVITLPCLDSIVTFKDINPNSDLDNQQVYEYKGQIEFMNQFVVSGSYWEAYDYKWIDKKTGKEISFSDFPYISPDKKRIISVYTNPYDEVVELSLYTIDDNLQVKEILLAHFTNWMAYNHEEDSIFWSGDGYFYIPINHRVKFWNESGNFNEKCQYIRIKIQ